MNKHLMQKRILIFGATGGIGTAISKHFASQNVEVWSIARSASRLKKLYQEINQNIEQSFVISSLTNEHEFKTIQHKIKEINLKFNSGFHCAGHAIFQKIARLSITDWDQILNINLTSAFVFSKLFRTACSPTNPYNLIFLGSAGTKKVWQKNAAYGASKAGLTYFTKVLQKEIYQEGGKVWHFELGSVNTPFFDHTPNHLPKHKMFSPEMIAKNIDHILQLDCNIYSGSILWNNE